jgi:Ca-activated chloride channel homolog
MKSRALSILLSLTASALAAPAAESAGMIVIDPIQGAIPLIRTIPVRAGLRPAPKPVPLLKGQVSFGLRLANAAIRVEINEQVAKTCITQTFVNDTDQNLSGTYLFPLPEDTTFSSFSLHIDGKQVEGKILEAAEARKQYETIVRQMVNPGLLEYADYKTVRARIFPIPAHGSKKVELEYTQVLQAENGMIKYRFPLKTEGESTPAEEVKISVKLASAQGLRTIWSPSHMLSSRREGDHRATATYSGKNVMVDKDFLLYYSVSDKEMSANLLTHKKSGEDGYFLITITPPVQAKQVVGKDIVFVSDTSLSMFGQRMAQSKKGLKYLVNSLNSGDRFSIVKFNTDVQSFKPALLNATPENKKAALQFIEKMEPLGGTNIGGALKAAQNMLGGTKDRPSYLVMMTDGEPTVGETSVHGLLKVVDAKKDIRLFDFGVGYQVNTQLLNRLAEDNHGAAQYVEPEESLETAMSRFCDKIKSPVLSNVKLSFEGVQVKDMYPRAVKDIFAGSQVLILGKYKGAGNASCRLSGTVNGAAKEYSFPLKFEGLALAHSYLPRLWAMRRIAYLTEVAEASPQPREFINEIVGLSKKYGIITRYTSFLVAEPEKPKVVDVGSHLAQEYGYVGGSPMAPTAQANAPARSKTESLKAAEAKDDRFSRQDEQGALCPAPRAPAYRGKRQQAAEKNELSGGPEGGEGTGGHGKGDGDPGTGSGYGAVGGDMKVRTLDKLKPAGEASATAEAVSGKKAVMKAKELKALQDSQSLDEDSSSRDVKTVDDKTFTLINGYWTDSSYDLFRSPKPQEIAFGSKEYFDLLTENPGISKYLAVGRQVLLVYKDHCYKISFKQGS